MDKNQVDETKSNMIFLDDNCKLRYKEILGKSNEDVKIRKILN